MELTQARVRELFDYRKDGQLIRRSTAKYNSKAGDVAGAINKNGYRQISISNKLYRAHRLVYLWHHGVLPPQIDHIDCDKLNNRIENLRPATTQQNGYNKRKFRSNSSGYKGVSWCNRTEKWQAVIRINGRCVHLGRFFFIEDAARAYEQAAKLHHGEFARAA